MKKRIILIIISFLLLILLIPKREMFKDGGTVEYKSLVYKITKYHELNMQYQSGYKTGMEIEILGIQIYVNIKEPDILIDNEAKEKIIKINDRLYYEVKTEKEEFDRCGTEFFNGKIESNVDISQIPTENNQSNFEGLYNYTQVSQNVIMICPNNNTLYFKIKKNNSSDIISDGQLDIHSDFVLDLYQKVNPSNDISILKGLYNMEESFSNDYILSVGIMNLIWEKNLVNEEYINPKDVEEQIHKKLGYNIDFQHQDIYIFGQNEYGKGVCGYWYRPNAKQYQLIHGCGGNSNEFFKRKLISAEKKGDYIYIKEKSIYYYNDWDDYSSKRYIYNNYKREKLLDYIEKSSSETFQVELDNYIEDASTYMYIYQKINQNYILKEVRKI